MKTKNFLDEIQTYIPELDSLLNAGVEEVKLGELESRLGCVFPEDFRSLYLCHDGEGDGLSGIMAGFKWMDTRSLLRAWESLQESAYNVISHEDGYIKDGEYKKGWIPFAEDGGGSFLVLDLDPGIKGNSGQIITADRDSDVSYVTAKSFSDFLDLIVKSLKSGALSQDEEIEEETVFVWANGHFFDDVLTLSGTQTSSGAIKLDAFWTEYYGDEAVNGYITEKALAKQRMVFIRNEMAKKHGAISLELLKKMVNLKELILHAQKVESFQPLEELSSLTKFVTGSAAFKLSDVEYLAKLKNLKCLHLCELSLEDISCFQNITSLKSLFLYKTTIKNLASIGNLKNITELELDKMEAGDLSYLTGLIKLTSLNLERIKLPNLKFLKDLKKLTVFSTDTKAEDASDEEILHSLKKLKELNYPVSDLSILKSCPKLTCLTIDTEKIKDMKPFADANITSVTLYNIKSDEEARQLAEDIRRYHFLQAYSWRSPN